MKLPEPVACMMGEGYGFVSALDAGDAPNWTDYYPTSLFTESQLREALARQEAVMRQALEALEVIHDKSVFEYSLPSDHYASVASMGAIKALEDALK